MVSSQAGGGTEGGEGRLGVVWGWGGAGYAGENFASLV